MKKIPTLFERADKFVVPTLNPKAEWVLFEDSVAKRKYDGTCLLFDDSIDETNYWYARRTVHGEITESNHEFIPEEYDPNTNKTFGWTPIIYSPFYRQFAEASQESPVYGGLRYEDTYYIGGTYELIGPQINGNPENYPQHRLVNHYNAEQMSNVNMLDLHTLTEEDAFQQLKTVLSFMEVEGVVFYGSDGKLAKLKKRDFDYGQAT